MAASNENTGAFFYATFDKPEASAIEAFKTALGAVPQEAVRQDGSKYVKLHTDRATYVNAGAKGAKISAWKISADALREVRLEDYFKNVKYFASLDGLKAGAEIPPASIGMEAKAAAQAMEDRAYSKAAAKAPGRAPAAHARKHAEYLEKIREYKANPVSKAASVTAEDVMLYCASMAKYLAGFTGKTPFSKDIAQAIDGDTLFTIGLKGTKAEGIDLEGARKMMKKAAAEGRKARQAEEARYSAGLQNEAKRIEHEGIMRGLKRCAGLTVCAAFPPEVQVKSLDVQRQKQIDDRKAGISQDRGPSKAALEAEAWLAGKAPFLTAAAVKSQAGKLFWRLARDFSIGEKGIADVVNSDRILNAPESAFQDKKAFGLLAKQRAVLADVIGQTRKSLEEASRQYGEQDYKRVENKVIHVNFLKVGSVLGNTHEREIAGMQQGRGSAAAYAAANPAAICKAVYVACGKEDADLHKQIKALGGRWNRQLQAWAVPEENAGKLDLGGRARAFASAGDLRLGREMALPGKERSQEKGQALAEKQEAGLAR